MDTLTIDPSAVLPHRCRCLSGDDIDAVDAGKSARDTQLVTGSAWAIGGGRGHVGLHATPHLLIVEKLTQLCGAKSYFLGLSDAHVRSAALPGDVESRAVALRAFRRGIGRPSAVAPVGVRRIVRAESTSVRRPAQQPDMSPRVAGVRSRSVHRRGARARPGWTDDRAHSTFPRAVNDRELARSPAT